VLLLRLSFKDYNTLSAIELLEKEQDRVLQAFRKDVADLFKAADCRNHKAELHIVGFIRRLLILASGLEDSH
jgi:hypothetical protein